MSKTRQLIEEISAPGCFEALANAALRIGDEESCYPYLIECGVNNKKQSIRDPIDAIGYISDADKTSLILVEHTTVSKSKLKNKWLSDIDKALEFSLKEITKNPIISSVIIVVSCNKEPSSQTVTQVQQKVATSHIGQSTTISLDIWTGGRYAHLLDNKLEGQVIRQEYFGIIPTVLSDTLLHRISEQFLTDYSISLLYDQNDCILSKRSSTNELRCLRGFHPVCANPGLGKSTACYLTLKDHIATGGFAVVVDAKTCANEYSLFEAIKKTLLRKLPSLHLSSLQDLLKFCTVSRPLLVVVDDIHQEQNPTLLLEKIIHSFISIEKQKEAEPCGGSDNSNKINILCPIWPQDLNTLSKAAAEYIRNKIYSLPLPTTQEAINIFSSQHTNHHLSESKKERIVQELGNDPFLISYYSPETETTEPTSIIKTWINERIASFTPLTKRLSTFRCLIAFGEKMLLYRDLNPNINTLTEWFKDNPTSLELLEDVINSGIIINTVNSQISFRHDRIKNYLLVESLKEILIDNKAPEHLLEEPFFAYLIADALKRIWDTSPDKILPILNSLKTLNRLAVFIAYQKISLEENSSSELLSDISSTIIDICSQTHFYSSENQQELRLCLKILGTVQTPDIYKYTTIIKQNFVSLDWTHPSYPDLLRARLINGEIFPGIELVAHEPDTWHISQETIQSIQTFSADFPEQMQEHLLSILKRSEPAYLHWFNHNSIHGLFAATLIFIAIAAPSKISEALVQTWGEDPYKVERSSCYFWAFSRCLENEQDAPILEDEELYNSLVINSSTSFSFAKLPPTHIALTKILQVLDKNNLPLGNKILHLLCHIQTPEVLQRLIRFTSLHPEYLTFNPLIEAYKRAFENQYGLPLATECKTALEKIWSDCSTSGAEQRVAFLCWSQQVSNTDLQMLQKASSITPLRFIALHNRLLLCDKEALPDLLLLLSTPNNEQWWGYATLIWSPSMVKPLLQTFQSINIRSISESGRNSLSAAYSYLPFPEAEEIILEQWEKFSSWPEIILRACLIGSEKIKDLLLKHKSIGLSSAIPSVFGIQYEYNAANYTGKDLNHLLPFIHTFSGRSIEILAHWCNGHGLHSWRSKHLDYHLLENNGYSFTTWSKSDFEDSCNKLASAETPHMDYYTGLYCEITRLLSFGTQASLICQTANTWCLSSPSKERVEVLSYIIKDFGKREDIAILEKLKEYSPKEACGAIFNVKIRSI